MTKESVYLETTVVSYLTALPSRDIVVLAHQQVTREWCERSLGRFDIFISELVIQEASQGDPEAARKRHQAIETFKVLDITAEAERLALVYLEGIPVLRNAIRDALHLAIASASGMDYLVTWNCTHIARGEVRKALERVNDSEGLGTPTICTPEELLGE